MKRTTTKRAEIGVSSTTAAMVAIFNDVVKANREMLSLFDSVLPNESTYKQCAAECFAAYRDAVFAMLGEMVANSLKQNPNEL